MAEGGGYGILLDKQLAQRTIWLRPHTSPPLQQFKSWGAAFRLGDGHPSRLEES